MSRAIRRARGFSVGQVIFLLALVGTGLVLTSRVLLKDAGASSRLSLAEQAKEYLRGRNVRPLSGELEQLIASTVGHSVPSLPHPLLGKPLPSFELADHTGGTHEVSDYLASGPLVVVFYYGYYCNHCVGQLFAVHDDIAKFRELGANVVAISADAPQVTADRYKKFGEFRFPVLSDPSNRVAEKFLLYKPATRESAEQLLHGTFVIDREGIVRWCQYGDEPFTGNATLLLELATTLGRATKN